MPRKNHIWTLKDIEFLKLMYPTTPAKIIADEIGSTYYSVVTKLIELGIKKPNRKQRNGKAHTI